MNAHIKGADDRSMSTYAHFRLRHLAFPDLIGYVGCISDLPFLTENTASENDIQALAPENYHNLFCSRVQSSNYTPCCK
jgi:hypothetical protein